MPLNRTGWIESRAKDIEKSTSRTYGDKKGRQVAFALATLQAHKLRKTKPDYGTVEGREAAREKYRKPVKEYQKTAACSLPRVVKKATITKLAEVLKAVKALRSITNVPSSVSSFSKANSNVVSAMSKGTRPNYGKAVGGALPNPTGVTPPAVSNWKLPTVVKEAK